MDLGIKVPSSSVRTNIPLRISSTVTQASIKHDIRKTSLSLKNHDDNEQYQTEKVLLKGVTDLNTKHRVFNDRKIITNNTATIDVQIDVHLKNSSHPEINDTKIKPLDENDKFVKHHAESESSVTTEEIDLRHREGSNSDNETSNTNYISADDKSHDHDKETTKQRGRLIKANSGETHLNETSSANKNIDPKTTLLELSGQIHADKNVNLLKMLEEKEALNVTSLTPSNVKNYTAEHTFSTTSMSPFKGELVTATEETLRYREGSNSYNRTTNTHSETVDKRHDHDEETTKQVEGTTETNSNETHLNKTRSVNETTDPRTILMEQSGQRHANRNVSTLKILEEKEVLNVTSLTGSNVKNSIVTEGSNSDNRTTNNHMESAGKRHDNDEEITKQVGVTIKANSNETHLSDTRSANKTIDSKTTLIEQSGQRHANKSEKIPKKQEEKEVQNATTLTPSNVKNSTAERKILKTTSKSPLKDILVFVRRAKNEKVNIKTPFIPAIFLEA